jgi:coenzyme F420-0:L-glutamate ligase/coenzyme F420-1:gamma-L-glutamate ligase
VLIQINRRYGRAQAGVRITGAAKGAAKGGVETGLQVYPLLGIPLLQATDDLGEALVESIRASGLAPRDGDVVVVAQKVVSKVEGRQVVLEDVRPSRRGRELAAASGKAEALAELIASEASEIMRVREGLVIARHRLGSVMANAGIDASNVCGGGRETVLLWPEDPDASAARLRRRLEAHFAVRLAVIISDSLGRAWRLGTTGTAIGVAGIQPLRDRRGETDLFGRVLQATLVAVADELAGAASLVIGEAAEGVPAALIRGATYQADDAASIQHLLRPRDQDLFP